MSIATLISSHSFGGAVAGRQEELIYRLRQDCGSCHGMTLKGGLGPRSCRRSGRQGRRGADHAMHGASGTRCRPGLSRSARQAGWLVGQLEEVGRCALNGRALACMILLAPGRGRGRRRHAARPPAISASWSSAAGGLQVIETTGRTASAGSRSRRPLACLRDVQPGWPLRFRVRPRRRADQGRSARRQDRAAHRPGRQLDRRRHLAGWPAGRGRQLRSRRGQGV